ncbi:DUF2510 domain-containing protein [Euzebya sp.]|uniref:DUF2510 domain-containing protein n=1 Tax=Euzebya sp. TaxID=1971409 RepID=UPI0035159E74
MSQADAPAADWYPDPSGRFQFRYWDGESWTGHVSTDGKTDWDPPADGAQGQAEAGDQAQGAAEPTEGAEGGVTAQAQAAEEAGSAGVESAEAGSAGAGSAGAESAEEPTSGGAAPVEEPPADASADEPAPAADQPAQQPVDDSAWAPQPDPEPAGEPASPPAQEDAAQGGTIEEGEPSDANLVANRRASLEADVEAWVDEVANQVEPRLSRINAEWTSQPQAEAARACAYGLLIGHLAHLHPHMRGELSQVAEAHPSFTTLEAGARLDTLEQIARDHQRSAAWLGPLIGTEDAERIAMLFD